jgi:predicted DNA-binding transcriptional regulator AlpA
MLDLMDEEETAKAVGKSRATLRKWRRELTGPTWLKIGREVHYRPAALEKWLQAQECDPAELREQKRREAAPKGGRRRHQGGSAEAAT